MVGQTSDIWFETTFLLNDDGKFDRASLLPTTPPESSMPSALSDAAIASKLQTYVAKLTQMGAFSGIVTVARGDHIVASVSGGYANRSEKTAITGATQFTLGSLGKMFTAASIGQLVDQKKVSFGDRVGKFFPDYPNRTIRDDATVGMLLSHTAGLGDFLDKRTPQMMTNGVKRAAEFMPLYENDEPQFKPGTQWAYSNAGLALAGAIVEKVSGEDYPDYLRKHIFRVAGMVNSDPNNTPHTMERLVTPYTKRTDHGLSADWLEAEHDIGSPAGGAISTAEDLVHFAEALRSGKLVSKMTFDEMAKPHGLGRGANYGYATEIDDIYGRSVVGHGGGFPGVSTHLDIVLGSPYTVVVLTNQDSAETAARLMAVAMTVERSKLEATHSIGP